MPTLQFKGKSIIWNHHMSVPYHTLEPVPELDYNTYKANGNLIVEGDNLVALKALLPQYAGRVKCIYIDPPYNTGNEGWAYNDNVNSPMINEWIGKEVGKDDLTKHDKWLCMMTPRLRLLEELLSDDGVIFISIDDNEVGNLRLLCDQIFGIENFIAQLIWKRRASSALADNNVSTDHEYVLSYKKSGFQEFIGYKKDFKSYKNPDKDPRGDWVPGDLTVGMTEAMRPNQAYVLTNPITGDIFPHNPNRVWAYIPESMETLVKENRILFPEDPTNRPMMKRFKNELKSTHNPFSSLMMSSVGLNTEATKTLQKLFGKNLFEYSKPTSLLKTLIGQIEMGDGDIILDSFSGSGTTSHAVMELNKEDGINRQVILVQMPENSEKEPEKNVCRDITRERIVRAIGEYNYDSGFKYLRVGQALDAETLLSGELPSYEAFANYVYYLATGEHLDDTSSINAESYFVGSKGTRNLYLIYSNDMDALQSLALNFEKAEAFRAHAGDAKITVYAPACFLDDEYLQEHNIEFVSIPYNLFNKAEEA